MELTDIHSDVDDDEETGLTYTQRKKRRRKHLGPGEDADAKLDAGITRAALIKNIAINACLIALWYSFSISISVYNKWMFSKENLDFHFPLFTTSVHMLVQFSLASLVLWIFPRFRPSNAKEIEAHHGYSHVDGNEDDTVPLEPRPKKPLMTKTFYLTRISPCGTATALDIGLGNFSLRFITLTFFTMCKSSVLAFVLLFAFLFKLEKPTWKLCAIILFMTVGVIMMVAGEAAFNALGFMLVMTASLCSGFRWSLTQILLLRNAATSNPFSSIFFLTPVMFAALLILALPIEGISNVIAAFGALSEDRGLFVSIVLMLFPGILAFIMVAAEFALIKRTSVVTLSVCGIFKEVLTISAASLTFGDPLSPINISGLVVTIVSIAGYNWLKYSSMESEARKEAQEIMERDDGEGKAKHSEDDLADPDAFEVGRDSMSTVGLMRDSLALATDAEPGGHARALSNGVSGAGHSNSPVKRPEDLE
ncbi:hypothetical protein PRZ48_010846 [Zasmidium cellare]|uniref:Sugar phosphate transporter domain-containing protein n=1 Tax=Zasmidium cellare TaxID=395010 RepID=A0ABR0E9T1_ZASCE|nr:hypothetical protein PRZ48_010846 [Zasmidium cellare]